jgi:hypothetical protein
VTKHSSRSTPNRLLPLNERVSNIIQKLAFAEGKPDAGRQAADEVSAGAVGNVIQAWRERSCFLPSELFCDVAWGMLLELLHAEIGRRQVSSMTLCKTSAAPSSSARRWLKALEDRALVVCYSDPHDAEGELVELTAEASMALRHYFRVIVQSH